jgi:hypothetical protein
VIVQAAGAVIGVHSEHGGRVDVVVHLTGPAVSAQRWRRANPPALGARLPRRIWNHCFSGILAVLNEIGQ